MIVRIRSKDGNFRFDLPPTASVSELVSKVLETASSPDPDTITISNKPRGNETLVSTLRGHTLQSIGIQHGDLLFVTYQQKAKPSSQDVLSTQQQDQAKRPWERVQEDQVDQYWREHDGKIPRNRDNRFCKHGANAMCDYCMPLEPYDAGYHTDHNIKHLSYHAYITKLSPRGNSAAPNSPNLPPLSPLSFKVKVPCPGGGHPDWPKGICTACQPSAITLQSQPFRMVDHLEIASTNIIECFLQAWRETGQQRFGWLIGRYEPYSEVPMGIKAVVEAIHEPPQEGELDGLTLGLPWDDDTRILELAQAASTPLTIVGYIFTDLDPRPDDRTKNVYKRHPQSFYLSSLEAIFAAHVQTKNPANSRASPTGRFSSRMVTAVLTGTEDGAIDVAAYQVSEQACAMVEADMIEASMEPGVVRVKEEDRTQENARYVPDVFFRYKNEYGLEVKQSAKPCFPVEYLLVNVSYGFPQNPKPLFQSTRFQIENRPGFEEQRVEAVVTELAKIGAPDVRPKPRSSGQQGRVALANFLRDWHLVAFLGTTQLISAVDMKLLMRVATTNDDDNSSVLDELLETESWQTLMTFARETSQTTGQHAAATSTGTIDDDIPQDILDQDGAAAGGSGGADGKACPHCTFWNGRSGGDCEVCGLPL